MVRCLVPRLPALPVCLAVVQLLSPCSEMNAENMELMWERSNPRQVVSRYPHRQEVTPATEYGERTSILRENITAGKAALWIQDVRASDGGNYLCYFQNRDFYAKTQVELKVAALGSDPHIEMKGYEAGGILLECTSAGWYPQPQIQWRDARGQNLSAEVATEAADPQGLYSASASVILEAGFEEGVTCAIRNPLLGQERLSTVSITGPFFQNLQPWMVALGVTLLALLGLLVVTGRFLWRQRKKIQALSKEKERERAEKEAAQAEKEEAQREKEAVQEEKEAAQWEKEAAQAKEQQERSAKEKLQDELRWAMIPYLPRGEQSRAYAEWKMALFQPADVSLDPDTAHPALLVSEDKRSLQQAKTWQNLPEIPERFNWNECVLGCESFTSGRHFWEVEVGDRKQWRVGVCRENVERNENVRMAPGNGFWTVGLNPGNELRALMDPQITLTHVSPPERVGVFLDYQLGKVSFYNAIDGSHIFTFPPTSFSGPLRPVFGISTFETIPLTICPVQKAVRRSLVPDPGPDPSLETLVDLGSADGNGAPQAEETCLPFAAQPGAEGPLNSKMSQQEGTEDVENRSAATFSTSL